MATQEELEARFQELWEKAFRGGVVHPLITLMLENLQAQIAALKEAQARNEAIQEQHGKDILTAWMGGPRF